jgi:hypothetical protein
MPEKLHATNRNLETLTFRQIFHLTSARLLHLEQINERASPSTEANESRSRETSEGNATVEYGKLFPFSSPVHASLWLNLKLFSSRDDDDRPKIARQEYSS